MSAKDAIVCAKDATMRAKDATTCARDRAPKVPPKGAAKGAAQRCRQRCDQKNSGGHLSAPASPSRDNFELTLSVISKIPAKCVFSRYRSCPYSRERPL